MKFVMTLKDPDGIYDSISEATNDALEDESPPRAMDGSIDEYEAEQRFERTRDKIEDFCDKWVEYGDYVYVEFDTETRTARVLTKEER